MKTIKSLFIAMILGISFASAENTETKPVNSNPDNNQKTKQLSEEEAQMLVSRLYEIRSLDKNLLTLNDKKVLRKEVNGIKEKLQKSDGVVFYLSGTAIIIIILLLILL